MYTYRSKALYHVNFYQSSGDEYERKKNYLYGPDLGVIAVGNHGNRS